MNKTRAQKQKIKKGILNAAIVVIAAIILFALLLPKPAFAANDPGHDTLYIEQDGDSELNGTLNITGNLTSKQVLFSGTSLDVRGDGTLQAGSKNQLIGLGSGLAIQSIGDIFINTLTGTTSMVYLGDGSDSVSLNITGALYIKSGILTVAGQNICLANGTNCLNGGAGNVTSVTAVAGTPLVVSPNTGAVVIDITIPVCSGTDKLTYNGSAFVCSADQSSGSDVTDVNNTIYRNYNVSVQPKGFPDRSSSSIAYDNATRNFSIAPTGTQFQIYAKGKVINKTAEYAILPDVNGLVFVYYNFDGTLSTSVSPWDVQTTIPVGYIYRDNDTGAAVIFGDERHSTLISPTVHEYLHKTFGTRYESGLSLYNYTTSGATADNSSAQFAITDGAIWDEDLKHNITNGSTEILDKPAMIPILYRKGSSGSWRLKYADQFPLIYSGDSSTYTGASARIAYNYYNGTGWTLAEIAQSNYGVVWYFATNNKNYPVIGILDQNEYSNQANAMSASFGNLQLGTFPIQEAKLIYRVIFQTSSSYNNGAKAVVRDVTDYRTAQIVGSSNFVATAHSSLTGLQNDDHAQYLLASGTRVLTANWETGGYNITIGGSKVCTSTNGQCVGGTSDGNNYTTSIGISGNGTNDVILNMAINGRDNLTSAYALPTYFLVQNGTRALTAAWNAGYNITAPSFIGNVNASAVTNGFEIWGRADGVANKLARNGSIALTANWNAGSFNITAPSFIGNVNASAVTNALDLWMSNAGDTATGNYTFNTNTLHIDSTNGRIGIGTAAPTYTLQMYGDLYVATTKTDVSANTNIDTIPNNIHANAGVNSYTNNNFNIGLGIYGGQNYTGTSRSVVSTIYYYGNQTLTTAEGVYSIGGIITNNGTITNLNLIRSGTYSTGTGVIGTVRGLYVNDLSAYSTPTTMTGVEITANTASVGTSKYGLLVGSISGAATDNYAIYTSTGQVRIGDNLTVVDGIGVGGQTPYPSGIRTASHIISTSGNLYAGNGGLIFSTATSNGEYISRSGNDLNVYTGGAVTMTVDGDSNFVGINTTTPSQTLEVNGNVNVTGTGNCIYIPGGGRLCGNSTCSMLYSPNGNTVMQACN